MIYSFNLDLLIGVDLKRDNIHHDLCCWALHFVSRIVPRELCCWAFHSWGKLEHRTLSITMTASATRDDISSWSPKLMHYISSILWHTHVWHTARLCEWRTGLMSNVWLRQMLPSLRLMISMDRSFWISIHCPQGFNIVQTQSKDLHWYVALLVKGQQNKPATIQATYAIHSGCVKTQTYPAEFLKPVGILKVLISLIHE